jgi:MOSC domain-containing protein YiiM
MATVGSVNIATERGDGSGIDKRPVDGVVTVFSPGPKGIGASGVTGDQVRDLRHHGGDDQAVYAYAREDLDYWARELGRPLRSGTFGENITTSGIDIAAARIGERWRIGTATLQVTEPRIPCRTFANWLAIGGWVKTFTAAVRPGAYLRVVEAGAIRATDEITVTHSPDHDVTVGQVFRATTTEADMLPLLWAAGADLTDELRATVVARTRSFSGRR